MSDEKKIGYLHLTFANGGYAKTTPVTEREWKIWVGTMGDGDEPVTYIPENRPNVYVTVLADTIKRIELHLMKGEAL